ncbi:MAG: tRNA (N(6)-L-threonylcarbamoyladenosine(37)-C(2))-methylthiotransferase MtaB [Bacteroidales bacterium]|jgi:threonylcarbamoyladenosine tRNA methylthiotransferase MtaB|nr:tRNA (N(6)-L-threonylcarbamoyladenosine(37)-C(2))-methylthiotransferase MtaB [Bacteroidales bacterium]
MKKSVAFHTLGCKLNFAESSDLGRKFVENGYTLVDFKAVADVYVINTCTVTALAEKKCRTAIRQAIRQNPNAKIAVVGCFSQVSPEEIAKIKGVDYVLGNADKHKLLEYLSNDDCKGVLHTPPHDTQSGRMQYAPTIGEFVLSYSSDDRTRTFLKIQDGCDYFCTYCAIPYARGRNRNDTIENTVKIAEKIAETGTKEIVLTGVNIGEFGKSTNETFFQLIQVLEQVQGIERYRISSIEPNLITDEVIDFVAESRAFLPHFHIPLQSGSNKVLQLMKRRYLRELFAERVQKIKAVMPHAFIAADVIVGFPGETDEDFEDVYQFIESLPLAFLHVFPYSERPNTPAINLPQKVSPEAKKQRSERLHRLSEKKHADFCKKHLLNPSKVLWEADNHAGWMYGFTENYIRVRKPFDESSVNTISPNPSANPNPKS